MVAAAALAAIVAVGSLSPSIARADQSPQQEEANAPLSLSNDAGAQGDSVSPSVIPSDSPSPQEHEGGSPGEVRSSGVSLDANPSAPVVLLADNEGPAAGCSDESTAAVTVTSPSIQDNHQELPSVTKNEPVDPGVPADQEISVASNDLSLAPAAQSVPYRISYWKCDLNGNRVIQDVVEKADEQNKTIRFDYADPGYRTHFDGYYFVYETLAGLKSTQSIYLNPSSDILSLNLDLYYMPYTNYSYVINVVNEDGSAYGNETGGTVAMRTGVTWDSMIAFDETSQSSDTYITNYAAKPGYKVGTYYYLFDRTPGEKLNADYMFDPSNHTFGDIVALYERASGATFTRMGGQLKLWATFVERSDYTVGYDVSAMQDGDQPNNRVNVSWSSSDLSPLYSATVAAPTKPVTWTYRTLDGKTMTVDENTTFADVYAAAYGDDASYNGVILLAAYAEDADEPSTPEKDPSSGGTDEPSTPEKDPSSGAAEEPSAPTDDPTSDGGTTKNDDSGDSGKTIPSDTSRDSDVVSPATTDGSQSNVFAPAKQASGMVTPAVATASTEPRPSSSGSSRDSYSLSSSSYLNHAIAPSIPSANSPASEDSASVTPATASESGVPSNAVGSDVPSAESRPAGSDPSLPIIVGGLIVAAAVVLGVYARRRRRSQE